MEEVSLWMWVATLTFVVLLVGIDLLSQGSGPATVRRSAWETAIWTVLGLAFGLVVYASLGSTASGEYWAGYLLERTLSVDNVFVFVVILGYFAVPPALQHRALLWGVIMALVLRAIFIFAGIEILERLTWMEYVFGAILLFTAFKLLTAGDEEVHPDSNIALRGLRKLLPITRTYHEHKLLVRRSSVEATGGSSGGTKRAKWAATPLLAVLLVLATTDLVFAVDSIPAIFAVTRDPFLIFTSNAFALLGLRSMALLLAGVMDRFAYLKHALAAVLALVGGKMMVHSFYHPNVWMMLGVIAFILVAGVGYSIFATRGSSKSASETNSNN